MNNQIQKFCDSSMSTIEGWFGRAFGKELNPMYYLGALTVYLFYIVLVSGIYVFVLYESSIFGAWSSLEYMSNELRWSAGIMRSLHRYASDAAIITIFAHMFREFMRDRFRGVRWYSWFTGIPVLWMTALLGISGYWLGWDTMAQYIAIASSEMMDWLPIFTEPMARNFLTSEDMNDRFFTLIAFIHVIGIPIFLVFGVWIHLFRISRSTINPPRGLAIGTLLALVVLSIVYPAVSHEQANLDTIPASVNLDWFYLNIFPLADSWSMGAIWALVWGVSVFLMILPWFPIKKQPPVAVVFPEECNGCGQCEDDCPYSAIEMVKREDDSPYDEVAVVQADHCVSCGICAGSCPSSTPFRKMDPLVTGIDMPDDSIHALRNDTNTVLENLSEDTRMIVYGCAHAANLDQYNNSGTAVITLPCTGMLPASFIDYSLRRGNVDGVFITGWVDNNCHFRHGNNWLDERIDHERKPALRSRVDRNRVHIFRAETSDQKKLGGALDEFRSYLEGYKPDTVEKEETKEVENHD